MKITYRRTIKIFKGFFLYFFLQLRWVGEVFFLYFFLQLRWVGEVFVVTHHLFILLIISSGG